MSIVQYGEAMTNRQTPEGNRREIIIDTALRLFFDKGYDGTTVRSIMSASGAEIGLFYYYFRSKDEVFDIAVERFVESYRPGFENAYQEGVAQPRMALTVFFEFVRSAVVEFRAKYAERLHWSIRRAIRERALEIMEPYLEKILVLLVSKGMPTPPVEIHTLAIMLTHGVGGVILHDEAEEYAKTLPEMKKAVSLMLGSPKLSEE